MKRWLFTALAYLVLYPRLWRDRRRKEESFREVDCGEPYPGEKVYSIRLEASDGATKLLMFDNATDGGFLTFRSTSLKHMKWASELSNFDELAFDKTESGFGMLSIKREDRERHEFGIVSKACWDGLRRHVDGLIRTRTSD